MSGAFSGGLLFFPVGRCSFRWVCLCLVPSAVGLFMSSVFFGGLLFFPVGMFVSGVLSGGFFVSGAFFGESVRVWCLFRWVCSCLVSFPVGLSGGSVRVWCLSGGSICTCGV